MTIDFPKTEHIPHLRSLWKEAFGDTDLFLDHFFTTGFAPHRCRCVLEDNTPVAVLYWFDCLWEGKKLAYIYAVATAKSHRGKGLCHKLMDSTHTLLAKQGYAGIVLVPAKPTLFAFYEKMGYRCFGGIRQWEATKTEAIALTELTAAEFSVARIPYLNTDCVLQDGAMLQFLSTYTRFYQGKDFLLCCAEDDGKLIGYELLGNTHAASGILAALGFQTGTFRAQGTDPFAMYYSLTKESSSPGYFAFALD